MSLVPSYGLRPTPSLRSGRSSRGCSGKSNVAADQGVTHAGGSWLDDREVGAGLRLERPAVEAEDLCGPEAEQPREQHRLELQRRDTAKGARERVDAGRRLIERVLALDGIHAV